MISESDKQHRRKIHPRLLKLLSTTGRLPDKSAPETVSVIITMNSVNDWPDALRILRDAGLQITSDDKAINVVIGHISTAAIERLAALEQVQLIEPDDMDIHALF